MPGCLIKYFLFLTKVEFICPDIVRITAVKLRTYELATIIHTQAKMYRFENFVIGIKDTLPEEIDLIYEMEAQDENLKYVIPYDIKRH